MTDLYLTKPTADTVAVLSPGVGVVATENVGGGTQYDLDVCPITNRVALACSAGDYLYIFDPDTLTIEYSGAPAAVRGCEWSPDGAYLAISMLSSPYLIVYETDTWTQVTLADTPTSGCYDVSWTPDGAYLVAAYNVSSAAIYLIDTSDWSHVTTPAPPFAGGGQSVAANNTHIAVITPVLRVLNISTLAWESFAAPTAGPSVKIDFSPDGAYLAMPSSSSFDPYNYLRIIPAGSWASGVSYTAVLTSAGVFAKFSQDGDLLVAGQATAPYFRVLNFPALTENTDYTDASFADTARAGGFSVAPQVPTITPDSTSKNEGDTVTLSIGAPNYADGSKLQVWVDLDNSTADNLDVNVATTGFVASVVIIGESATLDVDIVNDHITEGSETIIFELYDGEKNNGGTLLATAETVTIADTSTALSYSITPNITEVAPGGTVVMTADVTGNTEPVKLWWSIVTDEMDSSDFDTAMSGSVVVPPDGSTDFNINISLTAADPAAEQFKVDIRTKSADGPVQDTSVFILVRIADTSGYSIVESTNAVNEGESMYFDVTAPSDGTYYYSFSGAGITSSDFDSGSLTGEVVVTSGTGVINLTITFDALTEGPESFVAQLRTVSVSGSIVATSGLVIIGDAAYTLTPDVTLATGPDVITWTAVSTNAPATETLYITLAGDAVSAGDFATATRGTVSMSSNTGNFAATLNADAAAGTVHYVYGELRRGGYNGEILAVSVVTLIYDDAAAATEITSWAIDYPVVVAELDHSAGTEYISNFAFCSQPTDDLANQPHDDDLMAVITLETRADAVYTLGQINVHNNGSRDGWLDYKWRGHQIRIYLGPTTKSRNDFSLYALAVNNGLIAAEDGLLTFGAYDAGADLDKPVLTTFLPDGNVSPLVIGKPFNITMPLLSAPLSRYLANSDAVISLTVRDNGGEVTGNLHKGLGYIDLSSPPIGDVRGDPETVFCTPGPVLVQLGLRQGFAVSARTSSLPEYDLGIYYRNVGVTARNILDDIAQSISGYWFKNRFDIVEMYQLEEPSLSADFELNVDDIVAGTLRRVAIEPPIKNLTFKYRKNWGVQDRDGILPSVQDSDPDLTERLISEWSQVVVENNVSVSDYPLAKDKIIESFLVNESDATTEAERIATLRNKERQRWELTAFIATFEGLVGRTVKITYPAMGWENGITALVVRAAPELGAGTIGLEVWF